MAVDAVIAIAIAASAYPLLELANQPDEQGHVSSTSSLILIYPVAGTGLFGASALDSYWSYRRCQDITREEERYRRVDHSPGQTSGLSIGP